MLKGVATSSTQIEGNISNNWTKFANKNNLNLNSIRHYERYEEDIDLIAELGVDCYRLSFEWSRIQPEQDKFDYEVIERYKEELIYIVSKDIKPLLTIHHFSNPVWFEKMGGFTNKVSIQIYLNYVKVIMDNFGGYINEYITFNEPNVYSQLSFLRGVWPPFDKSVIKTNILLNNMAKAHNEAYNLIHSYSDKNIVSFSVNIKPFMAYSNNILDKILARIFEYAYNDFVIRKFTGKNKYDFMAVNYYTRTLVKNFRTCKTGKLDDMGWEIYPEGIAYAVEKAKKYHRKIWVTENGLCTEDDDLRIKYIQEHLKYLNNVERYYYWSAFDNFEWKEGTEKRFGLIHVNYENMKRTIKKSGIFFSKL